jgi:hypothetical protein
METVREAMGYGQRLRMVVTQHPPTPGEGVLAKLANFVVGANVGQDLDQDTGSPQGMRIVWSKVLTPLLIEVFGDITGLNVTAMPKVPGGAASQIS